MEGYREGQNSRYRIVGPTEEEEEEEEAYIIYLVIIILHAL